MHVSDSSSSQTRRLVFLQPNFARVYELEIYWRAYRAMAYIEGGRLSSKIERATVGPAAGGRSRPRSWPWRWPIFNR